MNVTQRIVIEAVKTEDGLVPLFDNRITFGYSDMYGEYVTISNDREKHYTIVNCIYDLSTKEISLGIEIDIYPEKTEFYKGENVYFEKSNRVLSDDKIVDVLYSEYDLRIFKGSDLDDYEKTVFSKRNSIVINDDMIYSFKYWKAFYQLVDGTIVKYDHKLYHKNNHTKLIDKDYEM